MTDRTRKNGIEPHSRPQQPSERQPEPADIDWDACVTRLDAMLDRIENNE